MPRIASFQDRGLTGLGRRQSVNLFGTLTFLGGVGIISYGDNPVRLAMSWDGGNVYASSLNNVISAISIAPSTGTLGFIPGAEYLDHGGNGLVPAYSGNYLYALGNDILHSVSIYSRDPVDGQLTYISSTTLANAIFKNGVITSDSSNLYVTDAFNNAVRLYRLNPSTGAITTTAYRAVGAGSAPRGIVINSDNTFVYVANYALATIKAYSRNLSTGVLTLIGTYDSPSWGMLVIDELGQNIYTVSGSFVNAWTIDPAAGTLTALESTAIPYIVTFWNALAITPNGTSVYAGDVDGNIYNFQRDAVTGALTYIDFTTTIFRSISDIKVSRDNRWVYVSDIDTGVVTQFSRNII